MKTLSGSIRWHGFRLATTQQNGRTWPGWQTAALEAVHCSGGRGAGATNPQTSPSKIPLSPRQHPQMIGFCKGHLISTMPPFSGSRASGKVPSQGSSGLTARPKEQIHGESPRSMRNIRWVPRATASWSRPYCITSVLTLVRMMMDCTRRAGLVVSRKRKIECATEDVMRFPLPWTTMGCLLGRRLREPRLLPEQH